MVFSRKSAQQRNLRMKKSIFCFILLFCFATLLAACTAESPVGTTASAAAVSEAAILWEMDPHRGGYSFADENISVMAVVDGGQKYVCYRSGEQTVEFYMSASEILLLCTRDGITAAYQESHTGGESTFANPIAQALANFQSLNFAFTGIGELEGREYAEFCAVESGYRNEPVASDYRLFELGIVWLDGASYRFRYYVYDDGYTLISAEAPSEINPLLTPDTPWIIDLDTLTLRNTGDGTQVPVEVLDESTGTGTSLSGETIEIYYETQTCLYTDPQTGCIRKFRTGPDSSGALVTVVYDPQIEKPQITKDMIPMTGDTLRELMFLVSMLEGLFTG